MKMNRRVLSLLLAVVMVLGAFTSVFAAETVEEVKKAEGVNAKIQYLVDFDHVEGYEDGELRLDRNINRAEITKLIVHAEGYKALAERLQGVMQLYTDVNTSHWANGVISVGTTVEAKANNLEMLNGYPNGTFQPSSDVTYAELAKMLVVLVKEDLTKQMHDRANTPARWAGDWMLWAEELGILEDVTVANSNDAAPRRDAFVMMYNAMYTMKFVDRVPSNETMGVVSNYNSNKNEITLNQGDRAKTFTLNNSTTYVRAARAGVVNNYYTLRSNEAEIERYSFGSLVRVLADDKGNVTHIVELGNNKDGAINSINWKDVAEKTTAGLQDVTVANNEKSIVFTEGTLVLTNSTRYFITDINNERLTEVSKDDALKYGLVSGGKYQDVYAGYDVLEARTGLAEEKRATVVVFTRANKANDEGTVLRAKIQQNNKYEVELENTKGETVQYKTRDNRALFPFVDAVYKGQGEKLEKYDVVEVRDHVVNGRNAEILIRHKDFKAFPVVEVLEVKGQEIKIGAKLDTKTAWLRLNDGFDEFLEGELKKGQYIQYRTDNHGHLSNNVDIVSIVDKSVGLQGAITNVIYSDADLVQGRLVEINENTISVRLADDDYASVRFFDHDYVFDADAVKQLNKTYEVNDDVEFNVRVKGDSDYAYNIKVKGQTINELLAKRYEALAKTEADRLAKELTKVTVKRNSTDSYDATRAEIATAANAELTKLVNNGFTVEELTETDVTINADGTATFDVTVKSTEKLDNAKINAGVAKASNVGVTVVIQGLDVTPVAADAQ